MNPENDTQHIRVKKAYVIIGILLLLALGLGWWLGNRKDKATPASNTAAPTTTENNTGAEVKSIATYVLPDGWKESSCPNASGSVFITPPSESVNCDANPSAPVKLSVDPENNKDCNDIQDVQDVKKHVCISLYINGHKSLKATTEYLPASSYHKDITVNAYYIDTGKGVVITEYTYTTDSQFQAGFDQLANSVNSK